MGVALLLFGAGCSREQQDWRSAEAADTIEAYDQFVTRHPQSELAKQARLRVTQLVEDKDWQAAGTDDTAEAYRKFITEHPNGKWAQEARIRLENFSLGAQPGSSSASEGTAAALQSKPVTPAASPGMAAPQVASPGDTAVPAAPVGPTKAPAPLGPKAPALGGPQVPAPAMAAPPAAGSAFGIQLGAFGSEAAATSEWQQLVARFGPQLQGLSPHIVTADTAAGHLYRLQAVVGDEARARALCSSLKQRAQPCMPVLPR